ncbi:BTB/POZ domain-containing protein At3g05675 [Linum grandiflorum]
MDESRTSKDFVLGDWSTSDIAVRLIKNLEGSSELFYCHSSILVKKSKFFEDWISNHEPGTCVEIQCSAANYEHHVNLLTLLYIKSSDLLLRSFETVKSALGILEVSVALSCEEITNNCIRYLEAVPWEDHEEEEIVQLASKLGPIAMPMIARIRPVDLSATKSVFLSALRFATSTGGSCPPFEGDELRTSAQEQVEYMLGEDEETPLVKADDEVKSVVREGLSQIFSSFLAQMSSLLLESDVSLDITEMNVLRIVSDLTWMCSILPKMNLMKDFVVRWTETSNRVVEIIEDKRLDSTMWGLKLKLLEVTVKVLEAVGYGNVILQAPSRGQLLRTWLPYIRKLKPLLDAKGNEDMGFAHGMDEDLCQNIEGAIVSLILALPSNDQADILADWMHSDQVKFPDLSEAFEVWCYRTKSAKRRLVEGMERVGNENGNGNATVSL